MQFLVRRNLLSHNRLRLLLNSSIASVKGSRRAKYHGKIRTKLFFPVLWQRRFSVVENSEKSSPRRRGVTFVRRIMYGMF